MPRKTLDTRNARNFFESSGAAETNEKFTELLRLILSHGT